MQYTMGRLGGSEEVTLTTEQMPSHTHAADLGVPAIDEEGNVESPVGNALAEIPNSYGAKKAYSDKSTSKTTSIGGSLEDTGGNDAHSNMPPYQVVNYSIAMTGVYPQRS
jgi:microcystin-dependent protein